MMIDAAGVANQYTSLSKPEREIQPTSVSSDSQPVNESVVETGKTSEVGPAVVSNVSAATLESSRAVKPAEQAADQAAARDAIQARVDSQPPQEPAEMENLRKPMLKDVTA